MDSDKILLWLLTAILSSYHSDASATYKQNPNLSEKPVIGFGDCLCVNEHSLEKASKLLYPGEENLNRLVIYMYKDRDGAIKYYIPNREKQIILPDLPFEDGDKVQNNIHNIEVMIENWGVPINVNRNKSKDNKPLDINENELASTAATISPHEMFIATNQPYKINPDIDEIITSQTTIPNDLIKDEKSIPENIQSILSAIENVENNTYKPPKPPIEVERQPNSAESIPTWGPTDAEEISSETEELPTTYSPYIDIPVDFKNLTEIPSTTPKLVFIKPEEPIASSTQAYTAQPNQNKFTIITESPSVPTELLNVPNEQLIVTLVEPNSSNLKPIQTPKEFIVIPEKSTNPIKIPNNSKTVYLPPLELLNLTPQEVTENSEGLWEPEHYSDRHIISPIDINALLEAFGPFEPVQTSQKPIITSVDIDKATHKPLVEDMILPITVSPINEEIVTAKPIIEIINYLESVHASQKPIITSVDINEVTHKPLVDDMISPITARPMNEKILTAKPMNEMSYFGLEDLYKIIFYIQNNNNEPIHDIWQFVSKIIKDKKISKQLNKNDTKNSFYIMDNEIEYNNNLNHYYSFDHWFEDQMDGLTQSVDIISILEIKQYVMNILAKNKMIVTPSGILTDLQGRVLDLRDLKLRPILIGKPINVGKMFDKKHFRKDLLWPSDSAYMQAIVITLSNPSMILGIIPLGKATIKKNIYSGISERPEIIKQWIQSGNFLQPPKDLRLNLIKLQEWGKGKNTQFQHISQNKQNPTIGYSILNDPNKITSKYFSNIHKNYPKHIEVSNLINKQRNPSESTNFEIKQPTEWGKGKGVQLKYVTQNKQNPILFYPEIQKNNHHNKITSKYVSSINKNYPKHIEISNLIHKQKNPTELSNKEISDWKDGHKNIGSYILNQHGKLNNVGNIVSQHKPNLLTTHIWKTLNYHPKKNKKDNQGLGEHLKGLNGARRLSLSLHKNPRIIEQPKTASQIKILSNRQDKYIPQLDNAEKVRSEVETDGISSVKKYVKPSTVVSSTIRKVSTLPNKDKGVWTEISEDELKQLTELVNHGLPSLPSDKNSVVRPARWVNLEKNDAAYLKGNDLNELYKLKHQLLKNPKLIAKVAKELMSLESDENINGDSKVSTALKKLLMNPKMAEELMKLVTSINRNGIVMPNAQDNADDEKSEEDDDYELNPRIIGGSAATFSGAPLSMKGRMKDY